MFLDHFPFKDYGYMSWCGKVVVRSEFKDIVHDYYNDRVKRHEYGHVVQAIYNGDNWVRYYLSYYWNWLKHCPWLAPSSACYYFNKFECECQANDERPEYWKNYDINNLHTKYVIKHPRKKWRELGSNKDAWKTFLKSL